MFLSLYSPPTCTCMMMSSGDIVCTGIKYSKFTFTYTCTHIKYETQLYIVHAAKIFPCTCIHGGKYDVIVIVLT